jgi:hypothetical protein
MRISEDSSSGDDLSDDQKEVKVEAILKFKDVESKIVIALAESRYHLLICNSDHEDLERHYHRLCQNSLMSLIRTTEEELNLSNLTKLQNQFRSQKVLRQLRLVNL